MKRVYGIYLALALAHEPGLIHAQATTQSNNTKTKEVIMEKNKTAVRQLFEEVFNQKKLDLLKDLVSDDYVGPRGEKGAPAFAKQVSGLIAAFPDIHYTIEELIGDGDKVAIRWTWHGTHTAAFTTIAPTVTTIAPTGRSISNEGMAIYECRDGKIINVHLQTDRLGFLQQLDILPANPAAAAISSVSR